MFNAGLITRTLLYRAALSPPPGSAHPAPGPTGAPYDDGYGAATESSAPEITSPPVGVPLVVDSSRGTAYSTPSPTSSSSGTTLSSSPYVVDTSFAWRTRSSARCANPAWPAGDAEAACGHLSITPRAFRPRMNS